MKTRDQMDFVVGKRNDADVPKVSFIMDLREFPFFVEEQYDQVTTCSALGMGCIM